jgi:SAM-dependent methyltransferase
MRCLRPDARTDVLVGDHVTRAGVDSASAYWNSVASDDADLLGVSPMGGGGVLEVLYRHHFELRTLRRLVRLDAATDVLELGSGNARWVVSLAPLVRSYTAVDFSAPAMEVARRRILAARMANVELVQQNVAEYRPTRPFGVIYFSGVTQYLSDAELEATLSNIRPALQSGGRVIDRSTVSLSEREVNEAGDYFAIYRTADEIEAAFSVLGLRLLHRTRSYRPLRLPLSLRRDRLLHIAATLAKFARPLSFHVLHAMTVLADTIKPVPFEGGLHSHDFFVFGRQA